MNDKEIKRLESVIAKLEFCGYGGSGKNNLSCDGDVELLKKILIVLKSTN